jgi:hypothetical protein
LARPARNRYESSTADATLTPDMDATEIVNLDREATLTTPQPAPTT